MKETIAISLVKFFYKLYADDLVIIVKQSNLCHLISKLIKSFSKYDLILNPSKSAIFALHNHTAVLT